MKKSLHIGKDSKLPRKEEKLKVKYKAKNLLKVYRGKKKSMHSNH